MRWQAKALILVVLGFVGLGLAAGQSPFQLGGLGGFLNRDTRPDPVSLLRHGDVKKELNLSDEQSQKLDAAVWKAIASILDDDQLKRLKQIELQQRDYKAFSDPAIQAALKMTDGQKENIETIVGDTEKEFATILKDLTSQPNVDLKGAAARIDNIRKETKERCTEVLNAEQKRVWQEMIGDLFVLSERKELPPLPGEKKGQPLAKKGGKKKGGGG